MLRATFFLCAAGWLASLAACSSKDAGAGDRGFGDAGVPSGTTGDAGVSLPVVQCPATTDAVTKCGGVECASADPFAAQSCRAVCCTSDNQCGLSDSAGTGCVAQPRASTGDCPEISVTLGAQSSALQGCCTAEGQCGAIAFGACVSGVKLGAEARACSGLDDAGVDDAGAEDAGSAP